jgi:hypothetical protein
MSAEISRGTAVIVHRGKRALPAIVVRSSIVGVGAPGPHRYRYVVKPARIVEGVVVAIPAAVCYTEFKHAQIETFDPSKAVETSNWKLR